MSNRRLRFTLMAVARVADTGAGGGRAAPGTGVRRFAIAIPVARAGNGCYHPGSRFEAQLISSHAAMGSGGVWIVWCHPSVTGDLLP